MKKILFLIIVVGVVCTSSCKTEPPVTEPSNAIFYVRGEISGQVVNLNAGDLNYYMLPSFEDDTIGIREFNGDLGQFDCVGDVSCPESFKISFREAEISGAGKEPVEKVLYPRFCDLRGPATLLFESYKATFMSHSIPTTLNHTWYFGDGESSYDKNPVHFYLNSSDSIVFPVLIVQNASGDCQNEISYEVNFESLCDVDFHPTYFSSQINLNPYPTSNRTELWSYNGDTYEPFSFKGPPTDSITNVCLESTETATNCISRKCKNVVIDTSSVDCVANFDVIKEKVTLPDMQDYSEVTLTWQDKSGKKYNSSLFDQPSSSYLEIIEVEDYKDAPNGNATKKITIKFNLRLFGNDSEDFLDFVSEKSVVAVGYPKI